MDFVNVIFVKHFLIFIVLHKMEDLSEQIQKLNILPEDVTSGKCLKIELNFLDHLIESFYAGRTDTDIDFILTKNKIQTIISNISPTCCSMCNCSIFVPIVPSNF